MSSTLNLSSLPKTYLIDIDGTIFKHNGYLDNSIDVLLPNVEKFWRQIRDIDKVILLTSRESKYATITENALKKYNIRYDEIIYSLPYGERILINDTKPSGLQTAHAFNPSRDEGIKLQIKIDEKI